MAAASSGDIHLLDVNVRPCAYVKEVIEGSWKDLQDGAEKGAGRTLYGFKVYTLCPKKTSTFLFFK